MKQASRFMPKYQPPKTSKVVVIAIIAIVLAMVIYQPLLLAIFIGIGVLVVVWSAIEQPITQPTKIEKHFLALCQARDGLSICQFAREFDPKRVDPWIIRAVYEQLQAALPTKHAIPIKASDTLFETLMLDEDDLDLGLAEQIAQRTSRSFEDYKNNPYYGKVTTAQNLVLFFNHQPRADAR